LIVGQFVNAISGSTGFFMDMMGHEKKFKNIVFMAAAINIALNFLLTPHYGINGEAISSMVSLSFWNIYALLFIQSKFGMSIGYIRCSLGGDKQRCLIENF
jgi:O-antigen/teichoic acid export membrane protein